MKVAKKVYLSTSSIFATEKFAKESEIMTFSECVDYALRATFGNDRRARETLEHVKKLRFAELE